MVPVQIERKVTMATEETKDLATTEPTALAAQGMPDQPLGFEDDNAEDLIIPRIKCLQALSPEVQDGTGKMGTIINSLTLDNVTDRVFVPVCKFNNHILWRDRNDGGGIICRAADGKIGVMEDGTTRPCAACRKCEFDNTKQGREALPTCTKYINFLKTYTSKNLRKEFSEELSDQLWGDAFWSPSYYLATVGNVSLDTLYNYVENQRKK